MEQINFENIKNALRNQSKYDYLRMNNWVEMDKVINDYAPRISKEKLEFIPFESIPTYSEFAKITGPEVISDLFRFFININFEPVIAWVDELNDRELLILGYVLENFPFSEDLDVTHCTLTDILKSIVGKAKLPKEYSRERIKYEETK